MRGFGLLGIIIALGVIAVLALAFFQGGSIFSPKGDKTPQAIIDEAERTAEELRERSGIIGEELGQPQPSSYTAPVFLVLLEDNGERGIKIGCNDSVVAVRIPAQEIGSDKQQSIDALLGLKETEVIIDGTTYYNTLAQSEVTFGGLGVRQGAATLNLLGTIRSGGVCDDPRIDAQLRETLLQYADVREVTIQLNGSEKAYDALFNLR